MMASVMALPGAIATGIQRSREPVLAEVIGPLTAAVGDLQYSRVNFSEAGLGIWLGRDGEGYQHASAV